MGQISAEASDAETKRLKWIEFLRKFDAKMFYLLQNSRQVSAADCSTEMAEGKGCYSKIHLQ